MNSVNLANVTVLYQIDELVKSVLCDGNTDLIDITNRINQLRLPFLAMYDDGLEYNQTIIAFLGSMNVAIGSQYHIDIQWGFEHTQEFLVTLELYRHQVIDEIKNQQYQEIENKKQLRGYLNQLISHYCRLLFVRVDLFYRDDCKDMVSIDDFAEHMTHFRNLLSNKKTCFSDLQGFAWAIEAGKRKSFHVHLLLIYDGAKHQNAYGLALQVGDKWRSITDYTGYYFNCHDTQYLASLAKHVKIGIGMIHRNNIEQVQCAVDVASYLTEFEKEYQHPVARLPNMRTFGKGQYNVAWRRGLNRM
ncbi:inovirus Gp2 family protein [Moraxella osloensis]|nr:inovirus-type Gp2 protein [Moraxella osloensis]MDI4479533.1 inovirus Gp2 family protein [Moraxella osloensis]